MARLVVREEVPQVSAEGPLDNGRGSLTVVQLHVRPRAPC